MSKYLHAPHTLKDTCVCGHARETHYQKTGACLGVHCDECHGYENASEPAAKVPPPPSTDPIPAVLPDLDDDPSVAPVAPYYYPYSPTGPAPYNPGPWP